MHCSGKIVQQASLPKSKRLSSNVVLLFCNPFMLRAAEFNTDLQKNVFWTKHDLDLNIKEVDKKGAEIIGFRSEEIEKRSFYTLIHPEDLTALATCHKMLVESSDVQTVHFRLQTKCQDWVWMTSRGKVISKNSKKFSIAFSHCPLREEDSTYIQQEAILRRRYAISDLMCLAQFKQSVQPSLSRTSDKDDSKHQNAKSKKQQDHQRYHPYAGRSGSPSTAKSGKSESKKEEAALLDTSCILEVSCPSTWHCMSDRHSPVLPSSHVAHKISQREKQLQFQEFCRRQQMEDGTSNHSNQTASSAWNGTHPCSASPSNSVISGQDMRHHGSSGPSVNVITPSPNPAYLYSNESHVEGFGPGMDYGFYQSQASHSAMGNYVHHWYAPGEVMLNQSAVACLTPSRSPHQCGVMSSLQASESTQCSYQPPAHSGATHRQPSTPSCSYPSFPPCSMQSVGVGIAYAMSMPPSPPPSPLPNQRPVAAYQLGFEAPGENGGPETAVHAASKPEWFSSPSSSQQLYFPGYPSQQPPPYPGTGGTASVTTQSTIHDLKKTTEKFLPVKTEKECEEDRNLPGNQVESQAPTALESMGSYRSSDILGGRSSWALNHPFNTAAQMSHSVQLNTSCEQVNRNGILVMQTPMEVPVGYFPHAMQEAQMMQPAFFHSSSPATAQYMTYPYPSPYPNLGSPPAYPYSMYQQLGGQPAGQYPVHRFYTPQGVPLKTAADFSGPLTERSLDLPSIGSFLEYLNEV
ncbi:hypothetical protein V1264_014437 [Littorina saxatilis]|uniref:PAS domain-containing protein n=2 Tax=Littorina saxatilis TaxID=31220 RepID=A0AAN9BSB1_9CAEN